MSARAIGLLLAVAIATPVVAFAQQPVTCVPGTTICVDGQGHVRVGGQVGPGGASGTATASGRASGNAPAPPPQPPPPQPPPPPPPQPPPSQPPPQPTHPSPPAPPTSAPTSPPAYAPSYGGPSRVAVGIAFCPAMRVGLSSGFRGGGGLCMAFFDDEWGFGLDVLVVGGGTAAGVTEGSVHLSALYRFDPTPRELGGFFLRAGPELRTGFVHGAEREENWHLGLEIGAGYDVTFGSLLWRALEIRPYAAIRVDGQPTPDDRFGSKHDLGLLVTSGVGFN